MSLSVNLARKAKQVLETKTDDATLLQSLTALSTLESRDVQRALLPQELQSAVESNGVRCATKLLEIAEGVQTQLTLLQKSVADLGVCSEHVKKELQRCSATTEPYLTALEKLEAAEKLNVEKEHLIEEFLQRYQLLPEEAALLETGSVNEAFFQVLTRAQSIHANCKSLLRTQHQRAGLELMDTMARYQEAALKRLVRWIQLKCQDLANVEAAEMDPLMQQALQALSARPVLYRYCAEEVAETRHDALFERFVQSLSQGPRPIEMHSDDPKRYLNDMLAWVHQALASEIELLELLFKDIQRSEATSATELPALTDLLDKIFHSIDRPLKVRIEQVLMLPPSPVLCFELGCLLEFYVGVIHEVAGERFVLVESLQSCLDMSVRTLHEQLHARGIRLSRHSLVVPRDLTPSPEVMDTIQFLIQILNVHDSSLKVSERQEGLSVAAIASAVLDPLLQTCEKSAGELENGSLHQDNPLKMRLAKRIFLINCLEALATSLRDRPAIAEKWNSIHAKLESHVDACGKETAELLLKQCALGVIQERMELASGQSLSEDPELSLSAVAAAMTAFFGLISATDGLPEFPEIVDVDVKTTVVTKMSEILTDAYERIYNTLINPTSGYGATSAILSHIEHSPEHVKTILSIK